MHLWYYKASATTSMSLFVYTFLGDLAPSFLKLQPSLDSHFVAEVGKPRPWITAATELHIHALEL
jgi:hypothetical protein